jgi:hypothetical protein
MSMSEEERGSINYRFSGYSFHMLQLDSTGPSYISSPPHPYYNNQPAFWSKKALTYDDGGPNFHKISVNGQFPFNDNDENV